MRRSYSVLAFAIVTAVATLLGFSLAAADTPAAKNDAKLPAKLDFNRDVQPILSDKCYFCHGPDPKQRKAKLRLDTQESAYKLNSDKEAAVVPGKPDKSLLVARITSKDPDELMPPAESHRSLSAREIQILTKWIEQGAPYAKHWSFIPPVRPEMLAVKNEKWVRNPIDRLVLAKLEAEGLAPSPEAPRETLIRRVSLDLTGLPPTPQEVASFVGDESPDAAAFEKVADRLLASPAFGERMAWDWLDAARYADSNGYQGDGERTMWPWRDWVIKAFNENMPYDRFTVWQVAGDLLPEAADPKTTLEQKLATGFNRNHPINGEGGRIAEENRVEYIFDQVETTATTWLGLTFNCTRCHDHKFDALTKRDYYGMFAFFNQTPVTGAGGDPQTAPRIELLTDEQRARLAKFDAKLAEQGKEVDAIELSLFPRPEGKKITESERFKKLPSNVQAVLKSLSAGRSKTKLQEIEKEFAKSEPEYLKKIKTLRETREKRDAVNSAAPRVMVMEDMPKPRKTTMYDVGLYDKPGEEVTASIPAALGKLADDAPKNRLSLAKWLVAPENPLTARVTVNRFWQSIFGVGLVKTPNDFGVQGERPINPELLDYLAVDFRESGWDVKKLIRQIVTSSTYKQSSKITPALLERDPENRLLARGPRFRMPSWMLRDQALAVSGLYVSKVGGAPVKPYQPAGIWEETSFGNKKYVQDHGESLYRRSLYTFWRRIAAPTMFFDAAGRQVCTVKQSRTNSPLHALTTMNDVQFVEAARALAERVLTTAGPSADERIDAAYRFVLARKAMPEERKVLAAGIERLKKEFAADPEAAKKFLAVGESKRNDKLDPIEHAAYAAMCSAILNLDEALTKE
jgi:hypothetical protein